MRMRSMSALLTLAVLLTACGAASSDGVPPSAPLAADDIARLRATEFGAETVDAAVGLLVRGGVATYDAPDSPEPIVPVEDPSPLRLLRDQVRAMALEAHAGGGIEGAELDALVDTPPDLAAPSYILAGYVAAADTPGAELARSLMGVEEWTPEEWRQAPNVVFPQLVLALFTADVVRAQQADAEVSGALTSDIVLAVAVAPDPGVAAPAGEITGACSAVVNFIYGSLRTVFDALRLGESSSAVGRFFSTIWNFVVSVLETIITGIVRAFTQEVLDAIARVAAVVGTVASVVSAVRPWTTTISATPMTTEKGIAGIRSPDAGQLVARVDLGGLDEWPKWAEDCASQAGRPLPKLKPEGSPVTWETLIQNPPGLVQEGLRRETLDAMGAAQLDFTTLVDEVAEPYETYPGAIVARVTIERQSLRDLLHVVETSLWSELPSIVVGPVQAFLGDSIEKIKARLGRLLSVAASGPAIVLFHVEAPTPEPSASPPPSADPEDAFCKRYRALLDWLQAPSAEELSRAWARYIVDSARGMREVAPPHLLDWVQVVINAYGIYAEVDDPFNVPLAGPEAARLLDAALAMDAYCGIVRGVDYP